MVLRAIDLLYTQCKYYGKAPSKAILFVVFCIIALTEPAGKVNMTHETN